MGIAGPVIEFNDGGQIDLAAIVEIRRRELDIPQAGHFEGPIDDDRFRRRWVEALDRGECVESCLAPYPEHADRLEPLLRIVVELQGLPRFKMSHAARVRGRELVQLAAFRYQRTKTS